MIQKFVANISSIETRKQYCNFNNFIRLGTQQSLAPNPIGNVWVNKLRNENKT